MAPSATATATETVSNAVRKLNLVGSPGPEDEKKTFNWHKEFPQDENKVCTCRLWPSLLCMSLTDIIFDAVLESVRGQESGKALPLRAIPPYLRRASQASSSY